MTMKAVPMAMALAANGLCLFWPSGTAPNIATRLGALRDGNPAQRLRRVRAVRVRLPGRKPDAPRSGDGFNPVRFRSAALLPKG